MALRRSTPLVDQLPELYPYKDDGCELSPSCLNCPMPRCKYDDPGWMQRERRRRRDQAVLNARRQDGLTVPQLARRFRVSERTIFRILGRNGAGQQGVPCTHSSQSRSTPKKGTRGRDASVRQVFEAS